MDRYGVACLRGSVGPCPKVSGDQAEICEYRARLKVKCVLSLLSLVIRHFGSVLWIFWFKSQGDARQTFCYSCSSVLLLVLAFDQCICDDGWRGKRAEEQARGLMR
jgi:hypothetical protein